jgi:hypothetical protein
MHGIYLPQQSTSLGFHLQQQQATSHGVRPIYHYLYVHILTYFQLPQQSGSRDFYLRQQQAESQDVRYPHTLSICVYILIKLQATQRVYLPQQSTSMQPAVQAHTYPTTQPSKLPRYLKGDVDQQFPPYMPGQTATSTRMTNRCHRRTRWLITG